MMKNIFIKSVLLGSLAVSLNADFIRDNTKLVVNDTKTGLMWQDDTLGSAMQWESAIITCENLTLGGYSDWRLPNIRELKSIVDNTKVNPALASVFTSFGSNVYWSSTSSSGMSINAWSVGFSKGDDNLNDKRLGIHVRCVRAGQ